MRSSTQITVAGLILVTACLGFDHLITARTLAADATAAALAETNGKPAAETTTKKVRLANIAIKGELPESPGQMTLFGDLGTDLRKTIARLDQAAGDDKIAGVILEIRSSSLARGKLNELREAIGRVRASGKKVYAQMESAVGAQYLLASACDEIVMPEAGIILIPGIHAEFGYYKDLLEKIGIEADMMHMGDYKGAAEPLTRRSMSEPVKKNMTALVDDLFDQMVTQIATDRNLQVDEVRALIDKGLLVATEAQKAGLIDRVAYPDTFRKELTKQYDADKLAYVLNYAKQKVDTDFSGPMGMMKLFQILLGGEGGGSSSKGPKIAVVYAVGPIMPGKSESGAFTAQTMGSDTIVEALEKADKDENVKAIVLRVDSPGGSALASDLIWRATQAIDKPIVASMGDVAGSGGYYISMGADRIVAEPGTITGSIGVVGGKLDLGGLYDKIGITTDVISRGKNSGIFSSTTKFSDSEREAFISMMQDIYHQFTSKAAEGRHMPLEKLEGLAGGQVYSGRVAKRIGLVDELGTLKDAIRLAKQLAGLDPEEKAELKILPEPQNPFDEILGLDTDDEKEVSLMLGLKHIAPELAEPLRRAIQFQRVMREPVSLMMPFWVEIK
jgi:protease IV